jgi:endonuclease YncB( thermonuclease family)
LFSISLKLSFAIMNRGSKILKDGLFMGAFLVLASMIIAKLDLGEDVRLSGPFFAIDGDTLAAGAERLRLVGIDAPEADQMCGETGRQWACGDAAREALSRLASGDQVECVGSGRDRYDRLLVQCRRLEADINAALVREGMAVGSGDYQADEAAARGSRVGIWSGPFETPREWRKKRGDAEEPDPIGIGLMAWLKSVFR